MTLPVGDTITPVSSPMHLVQLMLLVLKETARSWGDPDYPFRFTDSLDTTGILFDVEYNKDSGVYGHKPVVIVGRGNVGTSPAMLGDIGTKDTFSGNTRKSSLISSSLAIKVIGNTYMEVDILSHELFNFLISTRTLLPQITTIHSIAGINLSQISPYEEGDHHYYAVLNMDYTMQYKWSQAKINELLASVHLIINDTKPEVREVIVK